MKKMIINYERIEKLKQEIAKLKERIRELKENEICDEYEKYLTDTYKKVRVGNLFISVGRIVKELEPDAFKQGLLKYKNLKIKETEQKIKNKEREIKYRLAGKWEKIREKQKDIIRCTACKRKITKRNFCFRYHTQFFCKRCRDAKKGFELGSFI